MFLEKFGRTENNAYLCGIVHTFLSLLNDLIMGKIEIIIYSKSNVTYLLKGHFT